MATATALTHEKVWFEKPSYDKAERLYFERMAKVMSNKIIRSYALNTDNSVINKHEDLININASMKSKTEKSKESKDNKSLHSDNNVSTDVLKQYKCQAKNSKNLKKENECNVLKMDDLNIIEKCDVIDVKEEDINFCNDTVNTKCTSKEVKEKKNKADTRHRNRGQNKDNIKEKKEQLPNKGSHQSNCSILPAGGSLANEVAKARQHIKKSLQCMDDIAAFTEISNSNQDVGSRIASLEKDNQDLRNVVQELRHIIEKLEKRVNVLEEEKPSLPPLQICPAKPSEMIEKPSPKEEDDEDLDLFGSDSEGEDAETAKIREERLAAYAAKKAKKPALIAKSNIIFDVKPWDDETDMKDMECKVRKIETDGLLWGAAKLVPLAFGIHKLQISCVVEDEKVSVDWLTEQIQEIEDLVQSVDIAAFNKI
ncbi:PREDICTED: probable elongation factor 1-delta isoform X1 [Polistes canadensis]|uniref:probable elongation factor 1-delta isoform X1 n=1 Tax=Polistes canadensis TaxID=91411 RepID=UPI0007190462|nr:PREDICTED: probable elongation factor 1-delta isoform X1 [Polistes canadensis]